MAPRISDSDSELDNEAPESVLLSVSKQSIRQHDASVQRFHTAEKAKKKESNRRRNKRLQEQAKVRRTDGEVAQTMLRMERAMAEAQDEIDEDGDEGDASEMDEEGQSIVTSGGVEANGDDEDEEEDVSMDTDLESPLRHPANPNHLPDHLFTAVFSRKISSPHHSSSRGKEAILSSTKQRARKQRRAVRDAKEIAIGNRTFAVLSKSQEHSRIPSASATVPSKKIQNFVDRSLLLKGGKSAVRGWERRPANIGVLRRVGPAAQFVRDK